ncbi:transmembrane protein C16orf54 homolog isoform X2 [Phascolarctos cinereus]|uniref:Transmembrane protein C16orf54 homolog n=1 Tax=Phascolarctos cinereus TaxID=38626 RepID=A0A6P5LYZ1_PHACI|nr:transmembrane protein C16orf54 homolog [Phascolarctos cinereus]XP_020862529.1 transmembrane protein C16orf54 homolog [Phascolarctos cinereus]
MSAALEQPPGQVEDPVMPQPSHWHPLLCGPCIPIMLALALVAAVFLLATAVLAERLFRRSLRLDPGVRGPNLVWRPGGELWIEPLGTAHERSEDWYGATAPLLHSQVTEPHILGGTLEVQAIAPSIPDSPLCPSAPPQAPESPASTFCVANAWEERPQTTGLVAWFEPQPVREPLTPPFYGIRRPGSPEPDWGLQPRVTLEQISAFWRRENRVHGGP